MTIKKSKKKTRATIWWVDDDFLRSAHATNAQIVKRYEQGGAVKVRGFGPLEFVGAIKPGIGSGVDLFLVDYKLNEHADESGQKYAFTGTGLVGNIRDIYPEHPIYLVSRILSNENVIQDSEFFDQQLTYKSLTSQETKNLLILDSIDYRSLRQVKNRHSISPIFKLLGVPRSARAELKEALPSQFQAGLGEAKQSAMQSVNVSLNLGSAVRFARWVRRVLLRFPGLLYDDLYAATFVGMNEQSFQRYFGLERVKSVLAKDIQYSGVFARPNDRRWWKNSIAELVYGLAAGSKMSIGNVWELGPKLFELSKKEMSRCAICGDHYPETVAYDPDDPSVRKPVHWRCSTMDQNHNPTKHFEQLRIFHR